MGHVLEHKGIGGLRGDGVLGEDREEFVSGIGTRVEAGGTHSAQDLGSAAVLGRCYQLEIRGTVVQFVAVEVVNLHAFRTRATESFEHEMVAELVAVTAHGGISTTVRVIGGLHRRTISVFDFLPFGIKEVAIRVSPEDFAVGEIQRYLFATVA